MRKSVYKPVFAALLLLAAIFFAVTHYGELTHVLVLLRNIEPFWLILVLFFQF